jgi:hypothetical protein
MDMISGWLLPPSSAAVYRTSVAVPQGCFAKDGDESVS